MENQWPTSSSCTRTHRHILLGVAGGGLDRPRLRRHPQERGDRRSDGCVLPLARGASAGSRGTYEHRAPRQAVVTLGGRAVRNTLAGIIAYGGTKSPKGGRRGSGVVSPWVGAPGRRPFFATPVVGRASCRGGWAPKETIVQAARLCYGRCRPSGWAWACRRPCGRIRAARPLRFFGRR